MDVTITLIILFCDSAQRVRPKRTSQTTECSTLRDVKTMGPSQCMSQQRQCVAMLPS